MFTLSFSLYSHFIFLLYFILHLNKSPIYVINGTHESLVGLNYWLFYIKHTFYSFGVDSFNLEFPSKFISKCPSVNPASHALDYKLLLSKGRL